MKFRVKDDYGEKFEVEEIKDDEFATETESVEPIADDEMILENEPVHDDEALTSDEISALKKLAGVVDKLMALIPIEEEEHGTLDEEEPIEEENIDETMAESGDDFVAEEEKEEVIDTNPITDSFSSLAKTRGTRDSRLDSQEQIANKWQENYSKFNK